MKTKNKIIVGNSLSALFLILFLFFSPGASANDMFNIGKKKFSSHTYVGPFNISDKQTKQAKSKLASDFSELQSKLELNLIYQDFQFSLLPEIVAFDIDLTLGNAQSGEDNPIIASVSRGGLKTILSQQLPGIHFSEGALESIAKGIEVELQTGIMPKNIHITDYLESNKIPTEELASSEYTITAISPALSIAIYTLEGMAIQPLERFSMMELLTEPELGSLSDEEMTVLASALYAAILQTNFQIDERNISAILSSNIQPGFEAAINQKLGLDFKFTNPNKTEFTIQADWSAGAIHLSIEGQPFYYTYEPTVSNIEKYEPRTVHQYSAFVDDGQVLVPQEGKKGMEVVVQKNISFKGKVINTEEISRDFYAPIHRIEVHPLTKADASAGESTGGSEGDNDSFENEEIQVNDGESSTEIDSSTDNGTGHSTVSEMTITGTEGQNEGKQIYDKSGLPIGGK